MKAALLVGGDVRADMVKRIKDTYSETQNMIAAAKRLGVSVRTLERCERDFPDVASAINEVRNGLGIIT